MNARIPANVKEIYQISKKGQTITISEPAFIMVDNAQIEKSNVVYRIFNSKCVVTLWTDTKHMHITILK